MASWAVLVYADKCIGCGACIVACQSWNNREAVKTEFSPNFTNPPDLSVNSWRIVRYFEYKHDKKIRFNGREVVLRDAPAWVAVPWACLHCADAPCARVCTGRAIKVTREGAVVVNQEECVGCKRCYTLCPYKIPRFDVEGKMYKCTFCVDRLQAGLKPACVKACSSGALEFTSLEKALDKARQLKAGGMKVYGIDLTAYVGGHTRWIYVMSKEKAEKIYPQLFPEELPPERDVEPVMYKVMRYASPALLGGAAILALAYAILEWRSRRKGSQ
ncbi:MAG: 4Fe-4S dicluster domain-containing protein [Acidilobaceae archaeon]